MRTTEDYTELLIEIKERASTQGITRLFLNRSDVSKIVGVSRQHLDRYISFPAGEKYVTPQWLARQLHRKDI